MTGKERNTFSLNLKTQRVVEFIALEKDKAGESKTSFINKLLEILDSWPIVLTAHTKGCSILSEIRAVRDFLNDELIQQIPRLAARSRRNPIQMLLYLVERGIEADEQLASIDAQNVLRLKVPTERSDKRFVGRDMSLQEQSTSA